MQRSVRRLTSRDAVLQAMELYDRLGAEEFLSRYGFGRSRGYVLWHHGRGYDSKAIAGVAFGLQHPESGPLRSEEFSGGRSGAAEVLAGLAFDVRGPEPPAAGPKAPEQPARTRPVSDPYDGGATTRRVLLVGCVKGKGPGPAPARELYTSDLFRKRRHYADASGAPWCILSALHGLVRPDDLLEPYDLALAKQPAAYRDRWGRDVVEQLEAHLAPLRDTTFEMHAGAAYVDAVRRRLEAAGARVLLPLRGLTQGQQLAWYLRPSRWEDDRRERPALTSTAVAAALAALADQTRFRSAQGFPWDRKDLDRPGLYAWRVDEQGARELSMGSGFTVPPGLVYAGHAGATAWPSGKTPTSTLLTRIRDNHLRGRLSSSTWRLSLAALLREPLHLAVRGGDLDASSHARLTNWMTSRLRLAVHPVTDRDGLGELEHAVLSQLDPPLNLDGRGGTPLRAWLTAQRRVLTGGSPQDRGTT